MNFFFGHFMSKLSYCAFLLLRSSSQDIKQLQTKQNRCLKIIFGLPMIFSTKELYTEVAPNVLPVIGLLFYSCLLSIKKSLLMNDDSLVKFEVLKSDRLKNIKIGKFKSNYLTNDITTLGSSLYNSLPVSIKSMDNLNSFKSHLKAYLLSKNITLISQEQIVNKTKIL